MRGKASGTKVIGGEGANSTSAPKTPTAPAPSALSLPVLGWWRVPVVRHRPAGTTAAEVAARGERRMTPEEIEAAVARAKAARLKKMGVKPAPELIREENEPGEEKWGV